MTSNPKCANCRREFPTDEAFHYSWVQVQPSGRLPDGRKTTAESHMAPLCEECFQSLTPEERLPFYLSIEDQWTAFSGPDPDRRQSIINAILMGL